MPLIAPKRPRGQIGISGQKPKKTPRPAPKTYRLGAVGAFGMREIWDITYKPYNLWITIMNDKNFKLRMIVQDDRFTYRKVYERKEKGHDWRIVWIETGHWFAINPRREKIRLTKSFRQLEKSMPRLAGRVKRNFLDCL